MLLLLRELDEADAAVARLVPSAEEVQEQIEAAEKLAQSEAGTPAKTEEVAQKMMRKWQLFVLEHGEAYGLDVTRGPTSEFIQTWGFHNRTMAFVSRPLRPLYSSSMKERTISFSTSQRDTKILR